MMHGPLKSGRLPQWGAMADDLADMDIEWRIGLARKGDWSELAIFMAREEARNKPLPEQLRLFLLDVFSGKVKFKGPVSRSKTYGFKANRYIREKAVAEMVEIQMRLAGRVRNSNKDRIRTRLLEEWCRSYDTSEARVKDYLRLPLKRRFAHLPKWILAKLAKRDHAKKKK